MEDVVVMEYEPNIPGYEPEFGCKLFVYSVLCLLYVSTKIPTKCRYFGTKIVKFY